MGNSNAKHPRSKTEPPIYTQTRPIEQATRVPLAKHGRPHGMLPFQKALPNEASHLLKPSSKCRRSKGPGPLKLQAFQALSERWPSRLARITGPLDARSRRCPPCSNCTCSRPAPPRPASEPKCASNLKPRPLSLAYRDL